MAEEKTIANPILEVSDLEVVYRTDEETVYAVNGLSLKVNAGETLGLVGETGAGKTTLALSIMKLLPERIGFIEKGTIILDGVNVTEASSDAMRDLRGEVVSMIFQDPMTSLNPVVTIGEQIAEILELHKTNLSKKERDERVDRMLEMIGISPDRKGEYPHQFSGGMKQRIVIAMALACEPLLLLADEPTTALDVTIQAQVLNIMNSLKERFKTATIFITHDLGIVAQTCDKVAVMYSGEIVEYGDLKHIFAEDPFHHPYTIGLFNSIPNIKSDAPRLSPINGMMPDPTIQFKGCRFAERCAHCTERCENEKPPFVDRDGHQVRCFLFAKDDDMPNKTEVQAQ